MVPWGKYYIKCPGCGHSFLPWNALMVTDFPGGRMRVRIWCPSCKKEHLQSKYGKGEPEDVPNRFNDNDEEDNNRNKRS